MCHDGGQLYLDATTIDWQTLSSATLEVRYGLRYEYPGPIEDVRQALMLVPADTVGSQTLLTYSVTSDPVARPRFSLDQFGNRICHLVMPRVEDALEFCVVVQVEQHDDPGIPLDREANAALFLLPSPLTEPSPALQAVAADLAAGVADSATLAQRIGRWVHDQLDYNPGATEVSTTAQDVFEQRRGVCQDYAHLMIALCRLARLPARYVSGHLLDEGLMHAWAQVLLPGPAGELLWQPFDPLHERRPGMSYVTVAVGRDYGDVSPTRGSFRAARPGRLAASFKQAGVLYVE
jgi:transglutaminase-like putative cysteine protease